MIQKDILNARIDRKRKFPATIFLKALGFSADQILELFHHIDTVRIDKAGRIFRSFDIENMEGQRLDSDIRDTRGFDIVLAAAGPDLKAARAALREAAGLESEAAQMILEDAPHPIKTGASKEEAEKIKSALETAGAKAEIRRAAGKILGRAGRRVTRSLIKKVRLAGIKEMEIKEEALDQAVTAGPVFSPSTGEIILESNSKLSGDAMQAAAKEGIRRFRMIFFDSLVSGPYISETLRAEDIRTREEALTDIYKRMRPGEPPTC